ncbi:hypothetical protein [Methanobacterium aggregans]|uniref:hypothetical protein n=1 Tax=Methanobacterium aggregans TaxID=1615586 RepID=UPI001AE5DE10|nr:hypothetical protein [Methanobacterium aggregans]MBP2045876.1 cobalamin biosynthesis protein CobD/CbiB [Methanobacterium aggregans]
MNKTLKIILYGILMWLVVFLVSFLIYPLKQWANPFFESIMPVVITVTVVALTITYFKQQNKDFLRESALIGVSWFVISIAIDLVMFLPPSPMHMGLSDYMTDVGFTYIIIPTVTLGMGYTADKELKKIKS